MDTIVYLKNMLRDKQVASLMPTSGFAVERVCSKIDFSRRNIIVEFGPGTGVFTRYLLSRLTSDSVLIVIERNEEFVQILHETFQDLRLVIYHDSAENIGHLLASSNENQADYIVSGIPFSFLPPELRETIVRNSNQCLRPGGKFLAYQTFFQLDRFLKDYLDQQFRKSAIEICLLNAPPLKIFEAVK
ncbi:class I SAM-dependent methyltransferase [Hymenobacter arizonensis]|uniref:Phospholipid N-methyltransferase n=1 Tax=Hymenobacter arizonensis TaxID=1227077 RepID=A0A1I5ZAZ2_HYMAR|nr:methyltransferase domain-containing protein [Hymenobacter arizonensis]SFQ53277.1 Phospholipid N-methyltransferase [Hymenobacter arizonensis]